MKSNFYVNLSIISFTFFFLISPFVKANPIVMGPSGHELLYILFLPLCLLPITIFIEYGIILLFVKKFLLNIPIYKKVPIRQINHKDVSFKEMLCLEAELSSKLDLLKNVFFVNLFTFPITQLFVLFLMINFRDLNYFYLIAELIPISLEIFLFLRIFQRYNVLGFLERNLSLNRRVFSILSANLVSFGLGLMLSFMQVDSIFK
ncbi:MAG: hypothetical protein EAX91_02400 [Candidatus Lokiarchaeota archaeon]|nr:hypothetical protein [Candidatus Lokiarchaeota archaeon]